MPYVYHYCGTVKSDITTTTMDGIIETGEMISSYERYLQVKGLLAKKDNLDIKNFSITSLSFLHQI